MGRQSCYVKPKLRKGLWSPEEDEKLFNHITRFGVGCWSSVPKLAGLQRCGKSCRLRWINYLRPDLKRGMFSQQEEDLILSLHESLGNRWAQIAAQLPGRTDNEIKNFWNSFLKKKLMKQGIDPNTHKPMTIDADERNGKDFTEKTTMGSPDLKRLPTSVEQEIHFNSCYEGGLAEASREQFESKPIFDHQLLYEFQGSFNPTGYNYHQNPRPYDQTQMEVNENPLFGFSSMPNLMSFDPGNATETDFSGNSTSQMGSVFFNGGKEMSSSSSSNVNNMVENAGFSWGADKLESVFESQMNGIINKSEEMKASPCWADDFGASYPMASLSQAVFQEL
ncbi:hypothetical protein Vadar_019959 [Vaccinium darrowii]|uniref:Uncharacterized protein n=1 Tax=Vaccinium darrowii TaxID=229202 RepID=A0ACB7ZMS2_9ERIC|nr:hypothetical protein Vadar_019959 [Vaccinium darrowii]